MRAALYIISTTVQRRGIADLQLLCMYVLYSERTYLPTYVSRNMARSGICTRRYPCAACAVPVPGRVLVLASAGPGEGVDVAPFVR
jgi:hypothetical protein